MTDKAREMIADIVADNLGDTYCCTRVWEAWSVGTMSQSDFHPAADDEDVTFDMADAILAVLPEIIQQNPSIIADMVEPLYFAKSHMPEWDGDFHTVPTKFTIRGIGDETYRLKYEGGFSEHNSPETAIAAANAHNVATILAALGMKEGE